MLHMICISSYSMVQTVWTILPEYKAGSCFPGQLMQKLCITLCITELALKVECTDDDLSLKTFKYC